jgi:hypothetical protein
MDTLREDGLQERLLGIQGSDYLQGGTVCVICALIQHLLCLGGIGHSVAAVHCNVKRANMLLISFAQPVQTCC